MYNSVYWHHSFRCIQAMFVYCAVATFGGVGDRKSKVAGFLLDKRLLDALFYYRVVLRDSWHEIAGKTRLRKVTEFRDVPALVAAEPALEFIWQFADAGVRALLERLAGRRLYRRVYEARLGELETRADYTEMQQELAPKRRMEKAKRLQVDLFNQVNTAMQERGPRDSQTEDAGRERLQQLRDLSVPLVVLDFPVRGVPKLRHTPKEISDPVRKYFTLPRETSVEAETVFETIKKLQQKVATVRVFSAPEFHELIIRYLGPREIQASVEHVMPVLQRSS